MTHLILHHCLLGNLLLEAVHPGEDITNWTYRWHEVMEMQHQCTHTLQQGRKTNLKAECNFTSDTSLKQANRTLCSFCWKRTSHLPLSPCTKQLRDFPPIAPFREQSQPKTSWSHRGTEDLSAAALFTHAGLKRSPDLTQEVLPLSNERGLGEVCAFPRKHRGLISAGTLSALPPNVLSCPAQTQNDSNAPDHRSCSTVFLVISVGIKALITVWKCPAACRGMGRIITVCSSVLNTCFLVACDWWIMTQ